MRLCGYRQGARLAPGVQEFGNSRPSDQHMSPGKGLESRKGGTGRAGDCAESREQPGATRASPEGKGKGKEELIKSALIQKRASKYWINVKTPRVGRERPLPNKKQSPVLHVNTFLQTARDSLFRLKTTRTDRLCKVLHHSLFVCRKTN